MPVWWAVEFIDGQAGKAGFVALSSDRSSVLGVYFSDGTPVPPMPEYGYSPTDTAAAVPSWGASVADPPPTPVVLQVPDQVPNASARRVMQRQFVPSGASFFTVVQNYLQGQINATASLADNDPNRIAALGAWTQWDMGNFFLRADPLVAGMAQVIAANGGSVDLDTLFIEAGAI